MLNCFFSVSNVNELLASKVYFLEQKSAVHPFSATQLQKPSGSVLYRRSDVECVGFNFSQIRRSSIHDDNELLRWGAVKVSGQIDSQAKFQR